MMRSAKPLMIGNRPIVLGPKTPKQDKVRGLLDAAKIDDYYDVERFQEEGIAGQSTLGKFARDNPEYVYTEGKAHVFGNPKAIVALRAYAKGQARSSEGR